MIGITANVCIVEYTNLLYFYKRCIVALIFIALSWFMQHFYHPIGVATIQRTCMSFLKKIADIFYWA